MPKVYKDCSGWGNHISWYNWSTRQVYGRTTPVPDVGDFWEHRMKSGKIAVFQFVSIEQQNNPSNMFFARVCDHGYKSALPENYHEVLPGIKAGGGISLIILIQVMTVLWLMSITILVLSVTM